MTFTIIQTNYPYKKWYSNLCIQNGYDRKTQLAFQTNKYFIIKINSHSTPFNNSDFNFYVEIGYDQLFKPESLSITKINSHPTPVIVVFKTVNECVKHQQVGQHSQQRHTCDLIYHVKTNRNKANRRTSLSTSHFRVVPV